MAVNDAIQLCRLTCLVLHCPLEALSQLQIFILSTDDVAMQASDIHLQGFLLTVGDLEVALQPARALWTLPG